MRYVPGFFCVLALGAMGCSDTSGPETTCGAGTHNVNGECVTLVTCGEGTTNVDNTCVPIGGTTCGAGTQEIDGLCVPSDLVCENGTHLDPEDGTCVPDFEVVCGAGTVVGPDDTCVPSEIVECGPGTLLVDNECIPIAGECDAWEIWNPSTESCELDVGTVCGSGGVGGSAGTGGTAGGGGTAGSGGLGGSGGNNAPVIYYVAWGYPPECSMGPTALTVTVNAYDEEDPTGQGLTYTGSVDSCAQNISIMNATREAHGDLFGVQQTLEDCLAMSPEGLTVTVTDGENSDMISAMWESFNCPDGCQDTPECQEPGQCCPQR